MRPDIGRYLEGRFFDTVQLVKTVYDIGLGQGDDVSVWIEGNELVFGRRDPGSGSGFLRLLPQEVSITLSFPRGHEISDPQKRARGAAGSRTRLTIRMSAEIDVYTRRMIDAAYALDGD